MKSKRKKIRPRSNPKPLTRRQVAIHEAGHAIVAIACGMIIGGVYIDGEDMGHTDLAEVSGSKPCPLVNGLVAWGGSVAVGVDWIGEDDAAPFAEFGFCKASILTLKKLTESLVHQYWPAVDAVARELDRRGSLTGTAVRRIAFKACSALKREAVKPPRLSAEARAMLRIAWDHNLAAGREVIEA